MVKKPARAREDGNPDRSQMDLNDVIIVRETLEKRGDPIEERTVHSLRTHRDHRRYF